TARRRRRSPIALAWIAMKSLPRWLISITDMPLPRQSRSSPCTRSSTGSGSAAGPALKLKTRCGAVTCADAAPPPRMSLDVAVAVVIVLLLGDALEPGELLALAEVDERHALGGATHLADRLDARADQHATGRDQHHLVLGAHQRRGDHLAVARRLLDRDHALGAARMPRVLDDRRALAVAVLGGCQHRLRLVLGHEQRDYLLVLAERHAAHAVSVASHRPHVVLVEAHRLAAGAEQHHVVRAVRERDADQPVAVG